MDLPALTSQQAANKLKRVMAERLKHDGADHLVDALYDLAVGCTVQEYDDEGNERIYTRVPDKGALTYIFDRFLGKPTEHKETHTTKEMRVTLALGQPGKETLSKRVKALPNGLDDEDVIDAEVVTPPQEEIDLDKPETPVKAPLRIRIKSMPKGKIV